jgi:hypothetical protein
MPNGKLLNTQYFLSTAGQVITGGSTHGTDANDDAVVEGVVHLYKRIIL